MSRVCGKDTTLEILVRRLVHALGYRFRLHAKDLPGKPDIVFRSRRKCIFVHGCFWHGHNCRHGRVLPISNTGYWLPKLEKNRARDKKNLRRLRKEGWEPFVVWECQTRDLEKLIARLAAFLEET